MKHDNWESFKEDCRKEAKLWEWTFERIREVYEKVAVDDIGRVSIVQAVFKVFLVCFRPPSASNECGGERRPSSRIFQGRIASLFFLKKKGFSCFFFFFFIFTV